jgi:hypothetical protein
MARNADQIAADWSQRLAASTQKITDGVNSVTVAPGQAAARQKTVWQQNTSAAVDRWAARTAAVSLPEWQQAMIEKGAPRIASGAAAAQPKFASFMTQLLPHIDQVKRGLPARGNLDQNIQRMTAFTRGMAAFKRTN